MSSLGEVEGRILEFLRSRRRGATAKFIAVRVGTSLDEVNAALSRLLTMDAIEKRGKFFRSKGRRRAHAVGHLGLELGHTRGGEQPSSLGGEAG